MGADPRTQASLDVAVRLAIAALIGLGVGLEREWSGHTSGPDARFAGLRTFFLLGLVGGIAGLLADQSQGALATAIALGGCALSVGAYIMAVRRVSATTDGTTEAAALVVIGLGILAGFDWVGVAAGAGAVVVLMLSEKARLHWFVRQLGEPEFRAGLQFAVLAVVVLPLLPPGPYFGVLAVKPRSLWAIVLVFSGLNFAGYIARRTVGLTRGMSLTGALGGIVSSTAVTVSFSRQSHGDTALQTALARGVVAASTILVPRVLLVSAAFNPSVALALLPFLLPALVVGAALVAMGWRDSRSLAVQAPIDETNPLRLWAAIRMALAFQGSMVLIAIVRQYTGTVGLYATASALGLTDVDALTVSMSRPEAGLIPAVAARAIAIGILTNTLFKCAVALVLGASGYRQRAAAGLMGLAFAMGAALLFA